MTLTLKLRWGYNIYTAKNVTTGELCGISCSFCTFLPKARAFNVYNVSAQVIEEEAISLIDQSFKTLHSSTAAFNMLLKFKHIQSREAINSHLMRKFDDVLVQFCKEVLYCERTKQGRSLHTVWLDQSVNMIYSATK